VGDSFGKTVENKDPDKRVPYLCKVLKNYVGTLEVRQVAPGPRLAQTELSLTYSRLRTAPSVTALAKADPNGDRVGVNRPVRGAVNDPVADPALKRPAAYPVLSGGFSYGYSVHGATVFL